MYKMSLCPSCVSGAPDKPYFVADADSTRIGSFAGTGAPVNVACPSISAGSVVQVAFIGGALPAGFPVIVITPGVGFAITVSNGSAFNYQVFG